MMVRCFYPQQLAVRVQIHLYSGFGFISYSEFRYLYTQNQIRVYSVFRYIYTVSSDICIQGVQIYVYNEYM